MPVEIATNMQCSDIKDRKRRAVKRAPKVKTYARAFKPKIFITTNLPERLAEEDGRFPPPHQTERKPSSENLHFSGHNEVIGWIFATSDAKVHHHFGSFGGRGD